MRLSFLSILPLLYTAARCQSNTVGAYLAAESPVAKANLLANIGPSGSKAQGAKAGVVIASPSTSNPDYLYTWTRDSSLVFQTIIDQCETIPKGRVEKLITLPCARFTLGLDTTLRPQIDNFVAAQTAIQQVSNPSGTVSSGGLGEPKFNIDETAFTEPWG
jgi:glucoamylase